MTKKGQIEHYEKELTGRILENTNKSQNYKNPALRKDSIRHATANSPYSRRMSAAVIDLQLYAAVAILPVWTLSNWRLTSMT